MYHAACSYYAQPQLPLAATVIPNAAYPSYSVHVALKLSTAIASHDIILQFHSTSGTIQELIIATIIATLISDHVVSS